MAALFNCRPELIFIFSFFFLFPVAFSDELQTLLSIKSSLSDPANNVFKNWEPNTPLCKFTGITCNTDGLVKEIELSNQGISGFVPFDKFCSLNSLEKLSLGFNSFSGKVTDDLNNCVSLNYLDVGNNKFTGSFPDVSSLSELTHFYANNSGFTGKFPWNSVANMSNLIVLSLGDNQFDRTPFPEVILKLNKLNSLYLSNCGLEGEIPEEIGNLTELINLELSMNHLTGEIPSGITKLKKLWQLELYENELTGKLPVGLGNLTSLEYFDASINYLYGDLSEIGRLNQLVSLQLLKNQFSGEVPAELGEFKKLVNVSLYTNKLTGQLPQKLGSWAKFDFIDVSENNFTGPVPPEMCKMGTMRGLLILQNNFTGEIPESYANCKTMERIRVSKNSLSGVIPAGVWGLPKLQILDVAMNGFEGTITSDIGRAKSLGEIYVANNKFSGELPPEISNASSLVKIDCSNNQFSGEIPGTIGELKKLGNLYLQNNKFSGSIPDSLSSCVSLSEINMADNLLSGSIPVSLGSLPTLTSLNLSDNQLSGQIPTSLSNLKLNLLDFSNNQLTGAIPDSLSIHAYKGSFAGNNGLCSQNIKRFRRCYGESGKPREWYILLICLLVAVILVLVSLAGYLYFKKKSHKEHERSLKQNSWNTKSFHILTFSEDEILDGIKQDNLIGKGGSGSVYRVQLSDGTDFAVKHIWTSDSGSRKISGATSPMLGKPGKKSFFSKKRRTKMDANLGGGVNKECEIETPNNITIKGILGLLMANTETTNLKNKKVISLGMGDPTAYSCFHSPDVAHDAVLQTLDSYKFNGYSPTVGLPQTRKAIADYLSRDLPDKLCADDVYVTAGCTQAIEIALSILARPGANILLPRPGFPIYALCAAFRHIEVRYFDLVPGKGWEVDLNAVEALADRNTIGIVVINPGNPCGNVYSYQHLQEIAETAKKLRTIVIADEVYGHLAFGAKPFVPMGVFGDIAPVLTLGSLSKRWLVPGWRLGWLVTNDPNGTFKSPKFVERIKKYCDICGGPATFIQAAVPRIIQQTEDVFFRKTVNLLKWTADICCEKLKEIPCISCPYKPEGSMAMMVKLNLSLLTDISDDIDFCFKLSKEESVILLPGIAVGLKNWIRITFAADPSSLEEGLERLKSFCQRHSYQQNGHR